MFQWSGTEVGEKLLQLPLVYFQQLLSFVNIKILLGCLHISPSLSAIPVLYFHFPEVGFHQKKFILKFPFLCQEFYSGSDLP